MKSSVETLGPWERKMVIEVPAKEADEAVERAYRSLARNVRVKGFRVGKVPRGVLERLYGDRVRKEVVQGLVDRTYGRVLEEQKLEAVSEPVIEPEKLERGHPWRYTARLQVKPPVKVAKWESLSLTRSPSTVDDQVVQQRLERMAEMQSQLVGEEDSVRLARGHYASIDYEGTVDGAPFEGGTGKEVTLEIGGGAFFPGFEEQLEGMGPGEARQVTVTFPDRYGREDLAGKTAVFRVTLKEIKRKVTPALDDEFARDTGDFKTLEELREKVRGDLRQEEERESARALREQARRQLAEANPVEAPPALIEREFRSMVEGARRRFQTQGISLDQLGLTPEVLERDWRPRAELSVKASLILAQIAGEQALTVSAEEINKQLEPVARESGQRVGAVRAAYEERGLIRVIESGLKEEKALDLVIERASIQKGKGAERAASASGKEAGS
jgi:trigger factor